MKIKFKGKRRNELYCVYSKLSLKNTLISAAKNRCDRKVLSSTMCTTAAACAWICTATVHQHMDHSSSGSGPSVLLCQRGVVDSVTASGERFLPGGPGSIPHRVKHLVQLCGPASIFFPQCSIYWYQSMCSQVVGKFGIELISETYLITSNAKRSSAAYYCLIRMYFTVTVYLNPLYLKVVWG